MDSVPPTWQIEAAKAWAEYGDHVPWQQLPERESGRTRERQSEREAQGVCSRSVGFMLGIPVSVFHRWRWEESYESEQSLKPVA